MKKKVVIFIQVVFFYILFILVGYTITGRIERQHQVLPMDTTVVVNSKNYGIQDLAKSYAPTIYTSFDSPEPKDIQYEVAENNNEFVIIYHAEWKDEKHPNLIQDIAWRIFRFAYFGFTFKDSEYIQVSIDKKSGKLVKALFDSPVDGGFSLWANDKRKTTEIKLLKGNIYQVFNKSEESETLLKEVVIEENKLMLGITNWNHLFTLTQNTTLNKKINFDINYLSAEDYKWFKYARRYHGEVFTPKSPANTPIIFFASIIFITYLVIILRDYSLSPKQKTEKIKNA
jgi:hypothetical protein